MSDSRLRTMHADDPRCVTCQVPTILPEVMAKQHDVPIDLLSKLLPREITNRMATLDHVYSRIDAANLPNGKRLRADERNVQLMCQKCNHLKSCSQVAEMEFRRSQQWKISRS